MRWKCAVAVLGVMIATSCARPAAPPRNVPRTLPADSAATLARAVRLARPGFATQEEALRSGVYQQRPSVASAPPIASSPSPPPTGSGWVIQIAAFLEQQQAEDAAAAARRQFPARTVVIERSGEIYRVALAGWASADAARAELDYVQRMYPGAWIRARGIS